MKLLKHPFGVTAGDCLLKEILKGLVSPVELCGLSTGGIRQPDMLWLPAGLWGQLGGINSSYIVYTPPHTFCGQL